MRRPSNIRACMLAGLFALAACGRGNDAPAPAASEPASPTATASGKRAKPSPAELLQRAEPDAKLLLDKDGRQVWAVRRPEGRIALFDLRPDGQAHGANGPLAEMRRMYPDVDFGPLDEDEPADAAAASPGDASIDQVEAALENLIDATPGARQALSQARRGRVIELTAPALQHMVEGMGGSLAMSREELDALLASDRNRIGLSREEMKTLVEQAGPEGISLAQIEAMMPEPSARKQAAPATPAGRKTADCPGLVYGAGKREICLPLGALSFADVAMSFQPGKKPSEPPFDFPGSALGEPDYRSTTSADFISLGCDGELVLQFTDNVLVDVDGIDLYVFEIGPIVERTELAISVDGRDWVEVGVIEGSRSEVDIGPHAAKGEKYGFVRLRNAGKACGGQHSGADIDAVAAVGAEIRLSLDSAFLFDVGKSELKPEAMASLDGVAEQIAGYGRDIHVTVEGHTDGTGADAANRTLSEARARAVWSYLGRRVRLPAERVQLKGYGETRPVASNDTEEGRAKNRRVDLLISPRGR